MSKDYKIGYGKPPKEHQFQKGERRNPTGRPKSRKNNRTIINETLNRPVMIKENGRTRRVKYYEAFVHQLAAKALNGSTRDQIALFKLFSEYAPDLLKEVELPQSIKVEYILPDGKTVESYSESNPSFDTLKNDSKASPAGGQSDPRSDEDDSWLD